MLGAALAGLGVTAAAQNTITVGGKSYIIGEDAIPAMQSAQAPQAPQATPAPLSPDRLQQMVAPIALYPDALVSQILIASTYPVEVVEAYQWGQQNKGLSAAQAQQAVQSKPWDPSVQSLVQFPQILDRMYKGLDWTQDLGEAFLTQQADVMDAVQAMRQKAQAAGNLQTSSQQTVTQQDTDIVIQSPDPEVGLRPRLRSHGGLRGVGAVRVVLRSLCLLPLARLLPGLPGPGLRRRCGRGRGLEQRLPLQLGGRECLREPQLLPRFLRDA